MCGARNDTIMALMFIDKLSRYYHTLKYLKFRQIFWRLWYRFDPNKPQRKNIVLELRKQKNKPDWLVKPSAFVNDSTLRFLNTEHDISTLQCWNSAVCEKLWLYNLHYFDDLNAIDAELRSHWHYALIQRWIDENPLGVGNGWESYPLSLRIVNWIKWATSGHVLTPTMHSSLASQVYFLSKKLEWHLLGNHLLANAKALVFAGMFFEGVEAERWLALGLRLYASQLSEQILKDGGHFELSPMYHAIMVEDLLDITQLFQLACQPLPHTWPSLMSKMLAYMQCLTHPDGSMALFNDAAEGIAPSLSALTDYASRLGFITKEHPLAPLTYLSDSGYARLQQGIAVLLADIGNVGPDYLPGHAHADTLSFEFSLRQQRILVNSGTSTYATNALRAYQRSTAAHNTLVINGQDSSEVWGAFRVAKRARVFDVQAEKSALGIVLQARHNGYHRLSGKPTHTRRWRLTHDTLCIEDQVSGQHAVTVFFHFHPDIRLKQIDAQRCLVFDANDRLLASLFVNNALVIESGHFYPEFNRLLANQRVVIRVQPISQSKIVSEFKWM